VDVKIGKPKGKAKAAVGSGLDRLGASRHGWWLVAYSWSRASAIFTCLLIAFILREYRVPAVFVQFTGSMLLVALFIAVWTPKTQIGLEKPCPAKGRRGCKGAPRGLAADRCYDDCYQDAEG
jgi:hypothetical protein